MCMPVFYNTNSAFMTTTTTINSDAITKFFNTTCTTTFDHFFMMGSIKVQLFCSVISYFQTVKTNKQGMAYFYYLV